MNVELKRSEQQEREDEKNRKRRKLEIIESDCCNKGRKMMQGDEPMSDDSPDMFAYCSPMDVEPTEVKEHNKNNVGDNIGGKQHKSFDERAWFGATLDEIKNGSAPALPLISPAQNHTVFFEWPRVSTGEPPKPYPERLKDCWDSNHVRMPYSQHSLYPVEQDEDQTRLRHRWELVQEALLKTIISCQQLETAILSYNSKYSERWDFAILRLLLNEVLSEDETENFFETLLPQIIRLALQLPTLITAPVPLLVRHRNHTLSFSQLQIASLLANAFLCTFPRRNTAKRQSEYFTYPDINFNRLYQKRDQDKRALCKCEKIKCMLHYFRRVCTKAPEGVVTYSRQYVHPRNLPRWDKSQKLLTKLHITSHGTIEDEGEQMLQVDFANRLIGGGVLGRGCVQEEIRFLICPELIAARLFTEVLDSTEAVLIVGCERYSNYKGYGDTFEWAGNYVDTTPCDSSGRRMCSVIAIDALRLGNRSVQYTPGNLMREINKAYAGFHASESEAGGRLPGVATGNWGCGAFRGDARLKALLQLMAASEAGRPVAYFTFGDTKLREEIFHIYTYLVDRRVTVGQLWRMLCQYYDECFRRGKFTTELYAYLYQAVVKKTTTSFDIASGVSHSRLFNQDRSRDERSQGVSRKNRGTLVDSFAVAKQRNDQKNKPHSENQNRKDKNDIGSDSDVEMSLPRIFRSDSQEGPSGEKWQRTVGEQSREATDRRIGGEQRREATDRRIGGEQSREATDRRIGGEQSREATDRRIGGEQRREATDRGIGGEQSREATDRRIGGEQRREATDRGIGGEQSREVNDRRTGGEQRREATDRRSGGEQNREATDRISGSLSDYQARDERTSQSRPPNVSTQSPVPKRKISDYFPPSNATKM